MNKTPQFDYDEKLERNGIELSIYIEFIQCDDDPTKMRVFQYSILEATTSQDYGACYDKITLLDILKSQL